ncbi:MAG: hypothetical protein INH41_12140 [Myxococcaceae bacterium]|jgi:hypothetical protein|nr:hypothetical protein [Myxococcaceae bacterium]MCA3013135.1 hypothetical protein [Myxococcaceae bacterium]
MEFAVQTAWLGLAVIHLLPAASAFSPALVERLYGVTPGRDLAVLIAHRGVLFCAIVVGCALAAFDPPARRTMGVVVGLSMVGFLLLYLRAGLPAGPLRTIALVDAVGLAPLAFAIWSAWPQQAA